MENTGEWIKLTGAHGAQDVGTYQIFLGLPISDRIGAPAFIRGSTRKGGRTEAFRAVELRCGVRDGFPSTIPPHDLPGHLYSQQLGLRSSAFCYRRPSPRYMSRFLTHIGHNMHHLPDGIELLDVVTAAKFSDVTVKVLRAQPVERPLVSRLLQHRPECLHLVGIGLLVL